MTAQSLDPDRTKPANNEDAEQNWTTIHSDGTRYFRHRWPLDEARAGDPLGAFLAADESDKTGWLGQVVTIADDDDNAVALIVHPDHFALVQQMRRELHELTRQPKDGLMHVAVQGPDAAPDRPLVNVEGIRRDLAFLLARHELDGERPPRPQDPNVSGLEVQRARDAHRNRVAGRVQEILAADSPWLDVAAAELAWSLTPYPDGRGLVPIRAWSAPSGGGSVPAVQWCLAYATAARGLFVREGAPNLFGETFSVVSGSGYAIRTGFESREIAERFAVGLADAAPGIDWRVWETPLSDAPPELREPLVEFFRSWNKTAEGAR